MGFLRTNNFYLGALIGLVTPVIAFLLTRWTDWAILLNKPNSLYVLAGVVNLLLLRWYYRNDGENSARGVIMVTFIGVLVLIFTRTVSV